MITPILVAALRDADITTGDGHARQGSTELTGRYCVVWAGIEERSDGPSSTPNADETIQVQVTSVGETQTAAGFIARQARTVALNPALTPPPGFTWLSVPEHVVGQSTTRDPSTTPGTPEKDSWYRVDIYRYQITPAGS